MAWKLVSSCAVTRVKACSIRNWMALVEKWTCDVFRAIPLPNRWQLFCRQSRMGNYLTGPLKSRTSHSFGSSVKVAND